ncbi:hypothetical protein ES703_41204 [subsurface metagenome]
MILPKRGSYHMAKDPREVKIKIIRPRIRKFCVCHFCNTKQRFKKKTLENCQRNHFKLLMNSTT